MAIYHNIPFKVISNLEESSSIKVDETTSISNATKIPFNKIVINNLSINLLIESRSFFSLRNGGKGSEVKSYAWPSSKTEEFEKIKRLEGWGGVSKLIVNLLLEWLEKQKTTLDHNPSGSRYSTPDSTHWIDTVVETDIKKAKEDIDLVENQETLSKLRAFGLSVAESANKRSFALWQDT